MRIAACLSQWSGLDSGVRVRVRVRVRVGMSGAESMHQKAKWVRCSV